MSARPDPNRSGQGPHPPLVDGARRDPLVEWLRRAESSAGRPPVGPDHVRLAAAVRAEVGAARRTRRILVRATACAAAAVILLVVGRVSWPPPGSPAGPRVASPGSGGGAVSVERSSVPASLPRLASPGSGSGGGASGQLADTTALRDDVQREVELRQRLVAALLRQEADAARRAALEDKLPALGPDPRQRIEQQLERAAATLIAAGDRSYLEFAQPAVAAERYACVLADFSGTAEASVAADRLARMERH